MSRPLVSVIVPNYNHQPFLKQRLDSILNQSYQNFEVILLDDASTDGSQEILGQYKAYPKVTHLILNSQNSGSPFKQWQKGINLAKGEYIWIAESDDYCELTFLEKLIGHIKPKTTLTYCASIIVDSHNNKMGRHKWGDALDETRWLQDFTNSGNLEIKNYLKFRNTITNASAVIFKRTAIDNVTMPVHMKFCGDWFFWIEILKQGDIVYISEPLNYYRRHGNTTRAIQTFQNEKVRFSEYFTIICANTSFISNLKKIKNYDWILADWNKKKNTFGLLKIFNLKMPLVLFLRYLVKYKGL